MCMCHWPQLFIEMPFCTWISHVHNDSDLYIHVLTSVIQLTGLSALVHWPCTLSLSSSSSSEIAWIIFCAKRLRNGMREICIFIDEHAHTHTNWHPFFTFMFSLCYTLFYLYQWFANEEIIVALNVFNVLSSWAAGSNNKKCKKKGNSD